MPGHADKQTGALYNKSAYGKNPVSKMGPYHMESVKQERSNLLHDNPVAKDASGGRPWIAKHFKSTMSPLKAGHEGGDSPVEGNAFTKAMADNDGNYEAAKKQLDGMSMKKMGEGPEMKKMGEGPEMKYGDGPEMGHLGSPAESHCMGPRMKNESALPKKKFDRTAEEIAERQRKRLEAEKEAKKKK
jgi:hypothetical protein|tara:strand:+ start:2340 stop:2900 length:561 start_codon:yes stop_codon:yes gene_type:complete